jgi:hypothetical protein
MLFTHPSAESTIDLLSPSSPHFYNSTLPIVGIFISSLVNMLVVGPQTTKIMRERKVQETRDGKKYFEEGPKSKEMEVLNKRFARAHGISSLLNMGGFLATVAYGFVLGDKLKSAF